MSTDSLGYKLRSGKPNKFLYFVRKFAGLAVPDAVYRAQLPAMLRDVHLRADYEEIMRRVDYYHPLREAWTLPHKLQRAHSRSVFHYRGPIKAYRRKDFHTAYYFDQHDVTRYFDPNLWWSFVPGDVYFTPDEPSVVKSRLLSRTHEHAMLLKLDKLRHFMFLNDRTPFRAKSDKVIFRGKIRQSRVRTQFLTRFFHHPLFDCGVVGKNEGCPDEWMQPKKTIDEHLQYKFIMALEGNDVASNLKWVMSSNSLAVMTRPTCETWFMEGTLIPDYHYVAVKDDFSDLESRIRYYMAHPEAAEAIIEHAHQYVHQFQNKERERLISLLVMERYLVTSGQMAPLSDAARKLPTVAAH